MIPAGVVTSCTPAISAVLRLDEVRKAHTLLEQGSALGKIIMIP